MNILQFETESFLKIFLENKITNQVDAFAIDKRTRFYLAQWQADPKSWLANFEIPLLIDSDSSRPFISIFRDSETINFTKKRDSEMHTVDTEIKLKNDKRFINVNGLHFPGLYFLVCILDLPYVKV